MTNFEENKADFERSLRDLIDVLPNGREIDIRKAELLRDYAFLKKDTEECHEELTCIKDERDEITDRCEDAESQVSQLEVEIEDLKESLRSNEFDKDLIEQELTWLKEENYKIIKNVKKALQT
jgi:chromosome segregation ATPase